MGNDHAGVAEALGDLVGPTHVTQGARELAAAGASAQAGAPPRTFLVRPGSSSEISQVVRLAAARGAVVVPVGTASRRPAAPAGARPRVLLDMKRMQHVLYLDETSLVVQVQAGLTGLGLEELLLPRGLSLGDFTPAVLRSTIGGMLSVRTPGKSSPRHGFLEDAVLGLSAVLADGRSVHTRVAPRRATGPDLARALLGAEGRLGIITGATLRIHRRPESRLLDAHLLPSLAAAIEAMMAALRADARPAASRVYDAGEAHAHLGRSIAADAAVLVVATAGPPELAALDRELLAQAARARGGTGLGPAPAEIWWRRRFGHAVPGPVPPPPALEVAASPSRLAAVAEAVKTTAQAAGRTARLHVSRFGADGGCVFVVILEGDRPDPHGPARAAIEQAARAAGGHLVGERDPALEPYLADLARALDPEGVFAV
jgi:FAD/FMN-containing dehydrogenase